MAVGQSGRIVLEVNPDLKRRLYGALALDGSSLKEWFLARVEEYLRDHDQLPLTLTRSRES